METDFYELLGVDRNASDDDLKKAYRGLARKLHPDANPGDSEAEERFKQITLAYEVLRDPQRRRAYDQYGIDGIRGAGAGGAGDPFGFGAGMNLGDLFDAFFGGASPFGGGMRRGRGGPPGGADVETSVVLEFEEAVFGGTKEVSLRLPVTCDKCAGNGCAPDTEPVTCSVCQGQGEVRQVRQSILGKMVTSAPCSRCGATGMEVKDPCPRCRGEGRVTDNTTFSVDVPAGIDRGQTLRLTGKGAAGPRGGAPGDLYIHVDVKPHDRFERHGDDLLHQLKVSFAQAALGTSVKLETLDGEEDIAVEPGTQTGKVIKLRGRGVPRVQSRSARGDLVVQVFVETPEKLSREEEELLVKFAELRGEPVGLGDHGSLFGKIKDAFR